MSATIDRTAGAPASVSRSGVGWPRLLPGTELVGQAAGSGLREAPYLVRRCDGQVVQLSRLLFELARRMDGRDAAAVAADAGSELDVGITAEQVAWVAEHKLESLGLIFCRDGSRPELRSRHALLGLRFRVGVVPAGVVDALAGQLRWLFATPLVVVAVAALVACNVWLATSPGLGAGLGALLRDPGLLLALFGVTIVSLAVHELGHAAACRYGGARPGRIGVGLYLVWPVFFTDVTDSYRLSKRGRLRTDLGGIYFDVLIVLSAAGGYLITGFAPLLLVVVSVQALIVQQFMPWLRLDGYHIVSDGIGIPDLFARIKPVLASLWPGRAPDRRVTELKAWARAAVTVWVVTAVGSLGAMAVLLGANAAGFLRGEWRSLVITVRDVGAGVRLGDIVYTINAAVDGIMLLLPVAGVILTYLMLCRGLGASMAVRHSRVQLALATASAGRTAQDLPHSAVDRPGTVVEQRAG